MSSSVPAARQPDDMDEPDRPVPSGERALRPVDREATSADSAAENAPADTKATPPAKPRTPRTPRTSAAGTTPRKPRASGSADSSAEKPSTPRASGATSGSARTTSPRAGSTSATPRTTKPRTPRAASGTTTPRPKKTATPKPDVTVAPVPDPGPPPPLPADAAEAVATHDVPAHPIPPADVPPRPPMPVTAAGTATPVPPPLPEPAAPEETEAVAETVPDADVVAEADDMAVADVAPAPASEAHPAPAVDEPSSGDAGVVAESEDAPAADTAPQSSASPEAEAPSDGAVTEADAPAEPTTLEVEAGDAEAVTEHDAQLVAEVRQLGFDAEPVSAGDATAPALALRSVSKSFGRTKAVDGIDLTVPAGTFYGIVGPNGAGKTTTLSMIAGLLRPDSGEIRIAGVDAAADSLGAKRLMGILPDRLRTFDRLTGRQLLYYYGVLRGLRPAVVEKRTADLARAFDLTSALGRPVSDYSAGMTKKVMLAGAMIHAPRVLVLDEPFEAVDPVSSSVIIDVLTAYVEHGGTVVLSSHGMELVERMCNRVAVIVAGQVLAEGTVAEVRGELTLEQRFIELAGGLSDVEGLEWLHTFSD